ncbi:MAG: diguanylate cyclase [Eubacteriales bacterium]|nr:diguanylate cyclase [Eubacteriales bacterium]
MDINMYWISALTYAVIIGMILLSNLRVRKISSNVENSFKQMATWVLFFCLQDVVWGMCDANIIKNDAVFFLSSSVFHISTVVTTFFWLKYVLEYLGDKVKHKRLYLILDTIVISFQVILIVINIFTTTIFRIEDGLYVTGFLRPLAFINQYVVYLAIGVTTLFFVLKKETRGNSQYKSVFFFTLAPILLGVCQLLYPNAAFYSLGYFLGFFIIHLFVVTKDREEYFNQEKQLQKIIELNNELSSKQKEIDEQFEILQSMSGTYDYINLLDFKTSVATRFDVKDSKEDVFDINTDPHTTLTKRIVNDVIEDDYDSFWDFTNLSTLDERLKGKSHISAEFACKNNEWIQTMYVRIGGDSNSPLGRVAYALRNITEDKKREYQVYSALTNLVYSLHIFDLENDTFERLIESDILKKLIGDEKSGQGMANLLMRGTCKDEYLDLMLEFTNLSTITERTKGKKYISAEFLGKYNGWTRMTFMPIEWQNNQVKKIVVTTQIIDSEKNEMINLIYKSTTDELTRLYNRRMYEDDLDELTQNVDVEDCIVIAMDVNGLKTVNDTLGHKAGDELIIGASNCINKSFSMVGKSYRTGGDEFMAIVRCDEERLKPILEEFDLMIKSWTGNLVSSLSISYGYASAKEYPSLTIRELAAEADKRMYENKAAYYAQSGIERRKR